MLIGRDSELAALARARDDVAAGAKRACVIRGEAGIGKTALALDFARGLTGWTACVVHGERRRRESLGPVATAVRRLLRGLPEERVAALAGHARLDPRVPLPAAGDAPTAGLAFNAYVSIFEGLSLEGPTIVVFDDVQDLDQTSRDLLVELLLVDAPLLALITARSRVDEATQALLDDVMRLPFATELRLEPLGLPEIARLSDGAPTDLVQAVFRRSGGNPLYAKLLYDQGLQVGLPSTLAAAARERLAPLSEGEQFVLYALAISPVPLEPELLARIAPAADASTLLRLTDEGLVSVADLRYRLAHPYIADAVATIVPKPVQRDILLLTLDELERTDRTEELSASLADMARAAGDRKRWTTHALAAVEHSLYVREDAQALARIEDALRALQPDDARRFGLLRSLFTIALRQGGDLLERCVRTIHDDVGASRDSRIVGLIALLDANVAMSEFRYADAIAGARAALDAVDDVWLRGELLSLVSDVELQAGNPELARDSARSAVDLMVADGRADAHLALALRNLADAQQALGDGDGLRQTVSALDDLAGKLPREIERAAVYNHIAAAMNGWFPIGDVFAQHERAYRAALRFGNTDHAMLTASNDAYRDLQEGRWRHLLVLEADLDRFAIRSSTYLNIGHFRRVRAAITTAYVLAGDVAASTQRMEGRTKSGAPATDVAWAVPMACATLLWPDRAPAQWRREADAAFAHLRETDAPMTILRLMGATIVAAWLGSIGETDIDRIDARTGKVPLFAADAAAARAVLRLRAGRRDEARELALRADETFTRFGVHGFSALMWCALVARAPDFANDEAGRARALERAHAEGMDALALALASSAAERATAAAAPAVANGTPLSSLTRRERDVADLVAQGMTNRQIADQLFLSERTVDSHVRNILGKLELRGRAAIAALVVRAGMAAV